ncbi:helix-turn-helix transcriptional regulator [Mucilaginibacter robiniae]|uniref:Helix-turn-helix transcriptional regulator n=1 Tax=Mucilaginibacter robiniae TaxID=2728022 RepID=A0A7L5E1W5_9SPHI|nr:AraC family transcriptional regulator [Mucilaginibacter robiniae]QJD97342.1 helix-turn-helix transcriptional regulator [Mucilaginibacter robiniae]
MRAIANDVKTNVLKEQFIPDHLFLYIIQGEVSFFDGNKSYTYRAGECCIARKNHLVKFILNSQTSEFEPIMFCFDEEFLRQFQQKHQSKPLKMATDRAIIKLDQADLIDSFIRSIKPYYKGAMELDEAFEDLKYEELLIILLKTKPELSGVFFDFGIPQKINLEAYMNRNFRFNVSLGQFAYLTGRSLSAFKRDFKAVFGETPSRWLVKKRLQEAYVLLEKERRRPSDIYLDLGFESLSHFSIAFKKAFGVVPSSLQTN